MRRGRPAMAGFPSPPLHETPLVPSHTHTSRPYIPLPTRMPVCAVCSSPAPFSCARCKCVSYCSPAHQKTDWKAHKIDCPRLAQEALAAVFKPCEEELLLRITTCLAQNGFYKEVGVMVQLNKAFWTDEQIWDAYKDYTPGPKGRTRLMYASALGSLSRVKQLLARGARVNTVTFIGGYTALMGACAGGHLEVVRILCGKGANVNAVNTNDDFTALMIASQNGRFEIARELCARGANVNYAKETDGCTPLILASQQGHLEVVRELCIKGANVNYACAFDGFTSLMSACQKGHLEIARELCAKGANVNAARTDSGATALHIASNNGHLELVRELCARGTNVNAARNDRGTALHIASYKGNLEVVRLLLDKGADKSATTTGQTAFSLAAGPHKAALQALLKP